MSKNPLDRANEIIAAELPSQEPVRVLEAGGGSATNVRLEDRDLHFTVIDISAEQLARNTYAQDRILGDLEAPDVLAGEYDLIVCWDVLEHLPRPHRAMSNMISNLAPGGVLMCGAPTVDSVKGIVTRFSPHWFHVAYYRHIRGSKTAGQPGHTPFPTFLRREMKLDRVRQQGLDAGLECLLAEKYVSSHVVDLASKRPLLHRAYRLVVRLASKALPEAEKTDYVLLMRRPA